MFSSSHTDSTLALAISGERLLVSGMSYISYKSIESKKNPGDQEPGHKFHSLP